MSTASIRRSPLIIAGNRLSSGGRSATFAAGSVDSLLRSYLTLVRDLRGQRREPGIELRTEDVRVLAAHLGVTDQAVLEDLLDLMGATRAQRSAMVAMLAAGALTLVLTGSLLPDLSSVGVATEALPVSDAVATADEPVAGGGEATSPAMRPAAASATPGAASGEASPPSATGTGLVVSTPTPDVLQSARAQVEPSGSVVAPAVAAHHGAPDPNTDEPVDLAMTDDGTLVASVAPPIPPEPAPADRTATTELPDGTTVGVATPPVPAPADRTATTELPDGTTVGVAAPPVPAPADRTATTELPDGTTVGVATPPVPTTEG